MPSLTALRYPSHEFGAGPSLTARHQERTQECPTTMTGHPHSSAPCTYPLRCTRSGPTRSAIPRRSEEHTSELQSRGHLDCGLLLEKQNKEKSVRLNMITNNMYIKVKQSKI